MERRRAHHHGPRILAPESGIVLFDLTCAVITPFIFGLGVVFLWRMEFLYILYPALFGAAFLVLCAWVVMAFRGATRFWSVKLDLIFASLYVSLVALGGCWGFDTSVPVKAWITPPAYARMPSRQIEAVARGKPIRLLEGSTIHLSWQGDEPAPISILAGQEEKLDSAGTNDHSTTLTAPAFGKEKWVKLVLRRGWHKLAHWNLVVQPDEDPQIAFTEEPEITTRKTIRFAFKATDDYGVESVMVRIAPTSAAAGMPTEPVEVPLSAPAARKIETASYADLTALPWTDVPVTAQLLATDGAGHKSWSQPKILTLPSRAFHNPFARALIEERQKLLSDDAAAARNETANVMAGIARQQSLYKGDPVVLIALRAGAVRLVLSEQAGTAQAVAELLWQTAVRLEEGPVGRARAALADAERDLSFGIAQREESESITPALARVRKAMTDYFDALEAERARQPPALQEMDWPLATASGMLTPEDLQARLSAIGDQLGAGDRAGAREGLSQLQALIENLRTTPPELTPEQSFLAQQVFALRALVRSQKSLNDDIEKIARGVADKTATARKEREANLSRSNAQQQLLLAALRDVIAEASPFSKEGRACEAAMRRAMAALQQKNPASALSSQTEALTALQDILTAMTDRMRRAATANGP